MRPSASRWSLQHDARVRNRVPSSGRMAARDLRRRGRLPARRAVRPQRGRRARPHRVRDLAAQHPRRVPPRQHQGARPRGSGVGGRPRAAGADRPVCRPLAPGSAGHRGCGRVGAVQRTHRSGDRCDHADDRPQWQLDRQGGDRPDAQLVDRRLLPDQCAQPRVQHPPCRQRRRIVRRPAGRRVVGVRLRLARTVPGVRHPDDRLRRHRAASARTDPRPVGAPGDGCQRRCDRDRGDRAVVRRELADRAEDRKPQADLVEPAVPRYRTHRLRRAGVAALRAGVRSRRARPRHRLGHCRTLPARRPGAGLAHRHPAVPR